MSNEPNADKWAIREMVENWVLWRDAGDWDRFATVWHPDGWMTATWFQGPAQKFIEVSREGFNKGVNILHFLGGWTCDVQGNRAVSQVKMTIHQRAEVDPSAVLKLDPALLSRFPEGYRHLAYLQLKNGFNVKGDLPGLRGPLVEKLYAEGKAWLSGSDRPGEPL